MKPKKSYSHLLFGAEIKQNASRVINKINKHNMGGVIMNIPT